MLKFGEIINRSNDLHINANGQDNNSAWAAIASREWQVFGVGSANGAVDFAKTSLTEAPGTVIKDAIVATAFQVALRGPALTRIPAAIIGLLGTGQFLLNTAGTSVETYERMKEVAADPSSVGENQSWAGNHIGHLAVEATTMALAGTLAHIGCKSLWPTKIAAPLDAPETFKASEPISAQSAPEPSPLAAKLTAIENPIATANTNASLGSEIEASAPPATPEIVVLHRLDNERKSIDALLSKETDLTVISRMERGTRGAYLVRDPQNVQHIFKLVSPHDTTFQITASARAAAAVNSPLTRTSLYERVGYTQGHGSWYVQELLEGKPAPAPSDRLIGQMVNLNNRQKSNAVLGTEDWNKGIYDALYSDSHGWKGNIARSSEQGRHLVDSVQRMIEGARLETPRGGDIVHGDFQHYNALVGENDRMTGYVDWEGAGRGDRGIDLSRLLYDAYVSEKEIKYAANPETLQMLAGRIQDISGKQILRPYMGYWILQVADYGTKVGGEKYGQFLEVGRRIVDDLAAREKRSVA